jgi:hypothetical protein
LPNIAQGYPRKTARILGGSGRVAGVMLGLWLHDLESLEAISQDDEARRIFLRMAAMTQTGSMPAFLHELAADADLDDMTKDHIVELAGDRSFLLAVEEYLRRTQRFH